MVHGKSANAKHRALLVTGGCCHDYAKQKDIISEGISKRIPTEWEIFFENEPAEEQRVSLPSQVGQMIMTTFYTAIASLTRKTEISLNPSPIHKEGKPAIALHCAMHSYHWSIPAEKGKKKAWPEMLGVSSKGHGPKAPITINKTKVK